MMEVQIILNKLLEKYEIKELNITKKRMTKELLREIIMPQIKQKTALSSF